MALHSRKNRAWLEEIAAELDGAPLPASEFARTWAEVTERHAGFLRYQEIIIAIIESNVTLERLTGFKRDFAAMLPLATGVLSRQCAIGEEDATDLYLRLLYQAPGLWNHFHAADLTRKAMRAAGLPETAGSFVDAYADFVELCIGKPEKP